MKMKGELLPNPPNLPCLEMFGTNRLDCDVLHGADVPSDALTTGGKKKRKRWAAFLSHHKEKAAMQARFVKLQLELLGPWCALSL